MFAGPGLDFAFTGMVVTDSKLFERGHMIRRWADGIAATYEFHVIAEAPLNKRANTGHGAPGGLKAGLATSVERVGVRHLITSVTSAASYTRYVAGGTDTIFARGRAMRLPANPGFGTHPTHRVVRGQQRNQFFERAFVATARSHPSLQPFQSMAFKVASPSMPTPPRPFR